MKLVKRFLRWFLRRESESFGAFAIGMNSFIDKDRDRHIIMLDYDGMSREEVLQDVMELASFFRLADAEVFRTANGFHVFFWYDHVPFARLRMILDYSRCDPLFKALSYVHDYKTIRAAGKHRKMDLRYECAVRGVRTPGPAEVEVGNLKKLEYHMLKKVHAQLNPRLTK